MVLNMASKKRSQYGLAMSIAIVSAVTARAQLTPVLDCAALNSQTNTITAYFGYTSNTTPPLTIPLGTNNFVDAAGTVVGGVIPVAFAQQAQHVLFSVAFASTATVAWHLNGLVATANAASVASPACQIAVGVALPSNALLHCWDRNNDHTCDLTDDVDGDGYCTILDCAGPAGPAGNQGPAGLSGSTGPTGAAGTAPLLQMITAGAGTANATASCSVTQFLITGGGACTVPNLAGAGRVAVSAASSDGTGWSVSCNAGQATAVAVCASNQ
jgi:hypothetical protein